VVTGSQDTTARIWDVATGQSLREFKSHESGVTSAALSPDGKRIATTYHDGTARIWDAVTGQAVGEELTNDDTALSAAFSPDGKRIVTASEDKTVRLWDAATGRPIAEPLRGDVGNVSSAAFSLDGKQSQRVLGLGRLTQHPGLGVGRQGGRPALPDAGAAPRSLPFP
jgi:WD40 repeat protein